VRQHGHPETGHEQRIRSASYALELCSFTPVAFCDWPGDLVWPPGGGGRTRLHRALDLMTCSGRMRHGSRPLATSRCSWFTVVHQPPRPGGGRPIRRRSEPPPHSHCDGSRVMNIGPRATNPPAADSRWWRGYGIRKRLTRNPRKIKRAGGLDPLHRMDEPLWFGHYFDGKRGADSQAAIRASARSWISSRSRSPCMRRKFPGIVVGDIEPTVLVEQPTGKTTSPRWVNGFRSQQARPLAFRVPRHPVPRSGARRATPSTTIACREDETARSDRRDRNYLRRHSGRTSDEAWVADARITFACSRPSRSAPDHAIIQSGRRSQHVFARIVRGQLDRTRQLLRGAHEMIA